MVYSVKTDSLELMHYLSNTRFTDQAKRNIRIHMPNGNVEEIKQYVNYEKFPKTALIIISGTPKGQHQYEMNNTVLGNYIAQNGQGATIENGIGKFNKVKLPKIAGYKAMIKQIPSANLLNRLFMVRFMAVPSTKINADNEKQQEPSMRNDEPSFSDNKAKTDNKTSSQIVDIPKARSTESDNEIPSQIIDMPEVISTKTNNDKKHENPKAKSASNAKTDKTNAIQPRAITRQTFVKKANTSIMPKSKIALNNKKLVVNNVQSHDQLVTKTKLHKTAALLPKTGEDKDTVIGIIGTLAILLALISLKTPKENKKD